MKTYPFWLKWSVILLGLVLLFFILSAAKFILMPLAFAALLAMLLEPLSRQFEKLKAGRIPSILLSMLVVFVVLAGLFFLLSVQVIQFADQLPEAGERLNTLRAELVTFMQQTFGIAPEQQIKYLQQGLNNLIDRSGEYVSSALGATTNIFATLALLPLFIFFMMYYKDMYRTFLHEAAERQNTGSIDSAIENIQVVTQNYVVGMITVVGILALLNAFGLWLVGLDHALFFAVFAAVLAVIPYIGIILGSLPAILYALLFGETLLMPLGVVGVFAAVQFLEGNFITPNIIGSKVSINPFMALIALIIGGEVWGISGMILFVPMLGILRCIFDEVESLKPYGYLLGDKKEYSHSGEVAGQQEDDL